MLLNNYYRYICSWNHDFEGGRLHVILLFAPVSVSVVLVIESSNINVQLIIYMKVIYIFTFY